MSDVPDYSFIEKWHNGRCCIEINGKVIDVWHFYIGETRYFKGRVRGDSSFSTVQYHKFEALLRYYGKVLGEDAKPKREYFDTSLTKPESARTIHVELKDNHVILILTQANNEEAQNVFHGLLERLRSGEEFKLTLQAGTVLE
jgi:hypothetical protein